MTFKSNLLYKKYNERIGQHTEDEARSDIRARVVWRQEQNAFLDIPLTNVNANSKKNRILEKIFKKHEKEKKRAYNSRIMNVEPGTFTPSVFSLTGGEGPEALIFHKNLVQKISATTEEKYDRVLSLIRCKLSFLMCQRKSFSK